MWDGSRYGYAFAPLGDYGKNYGDVWLEEKKIIDAHDPVLGIDPARHLLLPSAWSRRCTAPTPLLGLPELHFRSPTLS